MKKPLAGLGETSRSLAPERGRGRREHSGRLTPSLRITPLSFSSPGDLLSATLHPRPPCNSCKLHMLPWTLQLSRISPGEDGAWEWGGFVIRSIRALAPPARASPPPPCPHCSRLPAPSDGLRRAGPHRLFFERWGPCKGQPPPSRRCVVLPLAGVGAQGPLQSRDL